MSGADADAVASEGAPSPERAPIKLAILAMHPVQYHSPLYRSICTAPAFDGRVLYLDTIGVDGGYEKEFGVTIKWDVPLLEGHAHEFVRNRAWRKDGGFLSRVNPGLPAALKRGGFDAILIQGYALLSCWIALFAARRYGIKVIWRGEVTAKSAERAKGPGARLRDRMIRAFFSRCDAVMYTCAGNKEFLTGHGLREDELFPFICAVDNDGFRAQALELAPRAAAIRREIGAPDGDVVVLFCGRLTERKRARDVLEAVRRAGPEGFTVVLMGDGPERDALSAFAREHGVRLVHLGFVNQSQISRYYAIADVFCLLSEYDPSPKALNEAMNFSVAPIVTETIGTSRDLVVEGETGFRVGLGDVDAIAERLARLRRDPALRERMAQAARDHVARFSFAANAAGLEDACRFALRRKDGGS